MAFRLPSIAWPFGQNRARRRAVAAIQRQVEAGAASWRWDGAGAMSAPVTQFLAASGVAAQRARALVANNPWCARAVAVHGTSLIGDGFRPIPGLEDETQRRELVRRFEKWARGAGFLSVLVEMARSLVVDGEALAVISPAFPLGRRPALAVNILSADQLDRAKTLELAGGARIVHGVEFDAAGNIVAYWLFPDAPDLPMPMSTVESQRNPAARVIHMFRKDVPGQVRGLSWFAPVLLTLNELDQLTDALLVKQKVAANLAAIFTSPNGSIALQDRLDLNREKTRRSMDFEPGTVVDGSEFENVTFSNPPRHVEGELVNDTLRAVAMGLGLTFEQLSGNLASVNFSSARLGAIQHRAQTRQTQRTLIVPELCDHIWRAWVEVEVLAGGIDAAAFGARRDEFMDCQWMLPGFGVVDPRSEVTAAVQEIEAGLKSREEVIAERGRSIDDVDRERARDTLSDAQSEQPPRPPAA